ncbi:unnamed protein product [Allacma fusca]|uniref:RNA helicase aquarius n=1 Tax=Allacma fusca TaxID=39272 RepID=A0A8J2PQ18_9HEXA|nr:unnamed protein product [Allacma fusca]
MVKISTADSKKRNRSFIPSVEQINADKITQLSHKYWASYNLADHSPFDAEIVEQIYQSEVVKANFQARRIALLEISQYLENYLWPNYDNEKSSFGHVMSIVCMVNEKSREGVPIWNAFHAHEEKFRQFFQRVLQGILDEGSTSLNERCAILYFLNVAFSSLEVDLVRKQVQNLVSLHVWHCLSEGRREEEFKRFSKWRKYWKAMLKRDEKESEEKKKQNEFYRSFFKNLIKNFLDLISDQDYTEPSLSKEFLLYCERFLELTIDLQALLPTRRYLNVVIDDLHLIVRCQMCPLLDHEDGRLFSQLLERLKFYANFEICNETGDPMSELEVMNVHYKKITSLQEVIFAKFPEMRDFALSNVNSVDTRAGILKNFQVLSPEKIREIAALLNIIRDASDESIQKQLILEAMVFKYERRLSQIKQLNSMALYPTEEMIWDENVVPSDYHSSSGQVLALPKINLQFLTLHDYLLRNFQLFRLESTYQIRQDVEDAVFRLKPWRAENGSTLFHGWARMAQPITNFAIVEVAKPNLGESKPSRVRADCTVNLAVRNEVKSEWESLRKHDACFLITVRPRNSEAIRYDLKGDFISQVGLVYVRGCEIEGMLDANGRVIEEGPEPRPFLAGDSRTFRVILDSNQYKLDMDTVSVGNEDVYDTFNIILRRKPKENNFKAVLETIRDLMNINCVVPEWIHDVILGYGDPSCAHYSKMSNELTTLDFNDTFLDVDHLKNSFPGYQVQLRENKSNPGLLERPFKITFQDTAKKQAGEEPTDVDKVISVEPYVLPNRGPYPANVPNLNKVRFTPTQIEAIRSGMQPGLTLVVGPPDVDERHLLRLGHGEEELDTEKDFSRYGRVNYVLAKRLDLLTQVERLQRCLNVPGDVAYTCETSGFFFVHHVLPRWEEFLLRTERREKPEEDVELVEKFFPFHKYFENAPKPLFKGKGYEEDMEIAQGCFRYIKRIFDQLDEFRAFELLRTGLDRSRYLLVKEAKIIAMTCTHAALKRRELVDLAFQYDNILMEEAAQILEIETFIPLLLQNPEQGRIRLKRWVMIGDHHQLPPVIKNMAFQKYGNMEQSLFARFVRLGVPTVELDAQGRARPSISSLYKWRYKKLGDLPHVEQLQEYKIANPGFAFDYQLINVGEYNGVGESEPSAYFFQNLAEAEYVVATFMYMRLLGYPAEKITILTTYNGQKALIKDVINTRCGNNALIGQPHKITTVDKYQGQQNDYILLSLVRTKTVGHLRDVRRLVVAMSRARLGLYVFARISLFANCFELTPAFSILDQRPSKLHLYPSEIYSTKRPVEEKVEADPLVINDMPHMANFVFEIYMQKIKELEALNPPVEPTPQLQPRDKLQPTPIAFEETNVYEKPAEIIMNEVMPESTEPQQDIPTVDNDTTKEQEQDASDETSGSQSAEPMEVEEPKTTG